MRKKKTGIKDYNSIITIDPEDLKSYKFQDNEIKLDKLTSFNKDNFYISYLSSKNLIVDSVEISRNIPDEDLHNVIDIQVYDELNFDTTVDYTIFYKEFTGFENPSKRKFNIFAIETSKLREKYKGIIKKVKYIDYIAIEPLLIKSVYDKNLLERDSVDCFLYFKKSDAFLAIYADGEYIYSKDINFSLERMHEKFCELTGEHYEYDDFINFIISGTSSVIPKESQGQILVLYKELLIYIKDVIFYAKRAYSIKNIDNLYINSTVGVFKDVDRYIKEYIEIEPKVFNFTVAKNKKEVRSEQHHNLMILSALEYIEEPDNNLNFSIFKRPPPLSKRVSGKIVYSVLFSIFVSLLYPAYQFGYGYFMKMQYYKLRKEEHKLSKIVFDMKSEFKRLSSIETKIKKQLDVQNKKLNFRKELLEQIYRKKNHYPMKVKILVGIFEKINRYNAKIYKVNIGSDRSGQVVAIFSVFSKKNKNITELIKSLTLIKEYEISTEEIKKDVKKGIYLSDIKVVLNDNS